MNRSRLMPHSLVLYALITLPFLPSACTSTQDKGNDGGTSTDIGLPDAGGFRPCLGGDGVTPQTPSGCMGCPVNAVCCTKSGACSASGQTPEQFCLYSGVYPNGCNDNGTCVTDTLCRKVLPPAGPHTITFTNNTSVKIWVGGYATGTGSTGIEPVGAWSPMWQLPAGATRAATVPFTWNSGRFWARTGCTYTPPNGLTCTVGDCKGLLNCAVSGDPPATLAEFTMMGGTGLAPDTYDVSMVDGYNVLVAVQPKPKVNVPNPATLFCVPIACTKSPVCWTQGLWPNATSPVGCMAPCHVSGYTNTQYCCKCDMTTACSCESGIGPGGCCIHANSYGCSPFFPPDQPHPTDTLCDYNGKNGRPDAAWDLPAQGYVDAVIAACPGVYGWQFHDMSSLATCTDPVAPVDYEVTFTTATFK